ncbi:redoxin domain-containing protein [Paraburkholderia sp. Tr-20389]|uniref:SCO family protein n=1 Tax=Paraburkholderia sp. Tr-20389 TaxID=2703903 RepID=UPI001F12245F|nr:SCO family protein [Paraburkholderia sp. Tr-20389]MBN3753573.1 redoxin domain-containing protein [Paraburkholderia sp. Tr-20389]
MDTHTRILGALILTGAGLVAQAAVGADAKMPADHHDASMNMDEANADDAAMQGMSAKQRVMKEAAAAAKNNTNEDATAAAAKDTPTEDAIAAAAKNTTTEEPTAAASTNATTEQAAADEAHAMPADMPMPAAHDAHEATTPAGAAPTQDDQAKEEQHSMSDEPDMHAHHHDMAPGTTRTTADYALPPVTLVRDDGKSVSLADELNDGRPVVLTFIYTSCTTICPMVTQTFEQLQEQLGSERDKVHIVSISIDPEQDTPARLKSYAERFGAGPEWQYYTGTVDASVAAQRAFNVYRGDKMNHTAVAFLRAAPGKPWLRLDGLATPDELLSAYHEVVASNGS